MHRVTIGLLVDSCNKLKTKRPGLDHNSLSAILAIWITPWFLLHSYYYIKNLAFLLDLPSGHKDEMMMMMVTMKGEGNYKYCLECAEYRLHAGMIQIFQIRYTSD